MPYRRKPKEDIEDEVNEGEEQCTIFPNPEDPSPHVKRILNENPNALITDKSNNGVCYVKNPSKSKNKDENESSEEDVIIDGEE